MNEQKLVLDLLDILREADSKEALTALIQAAAVIIADIPDADFTTIRTDIERATKEMQKH